MRGIDVSHWNPPLHYPAIKEAGYEFAFIKATEPANYMPPDGKDHDYPEHLAGAAASGLLHAPYHFWRYNAHPEGQIDAFLDYIALFPKPTCRYIALDVEDKDMPKLTLEGRRRIGRSVAFLDDNMPAEYDLLIYTAAWWWNPWVGNDDVILESGRRIVFSHYPLWCADYGRPPGSPRLPAGVWTSAAIHQYTSTGVIPESGDPTLDLNYTTWTREQMALPTAVPPTLTLEERVTALEVEARAHGWSV